MLIKMITMLAGPLGVMQPGCVADVTDEAGRALVAGGFAEDVTPAGPIQEKPIETEMIQAPETAAAARRSGPPAPRGRKGTL